MKKEMMLDKLVALIGGTLLIIIFLIGLITNFNSLPQGKDLSLMALGLLIAFVSSVLFVKWGLNIDETK